MHQRHYGGRNADHVSVLAGLQPVRGLSLTGSARVGKIVAAPAIAVDTAQEISDYEAAIGWERERLGVRVGLSHTAAFSPFGYAEFPRVAAIGPSADSDWLTVHARAGAAAGGSRWRDGTATRATSSPRALPPTHSMSAVTIRSKFLRQFPSGIFDLKLRVSVESWGSGVIGRDAAGDPIRLAGATFFRSLLQIQLQSFSLFWDRGNISASRSTYVPGFEIPAYGSVVRGPLGVPQLGAFALSPRRAPRTTRRGPLHISTNHPLHAPIQPRSGKPHVVSYVTLPYRCRISVAATLIVAGHLAEPPLSGCTTRLSRHDCSTGDLLCSLPAHRFSG